MSVLGSSQARNAIAAEQRLFSHYGLEYAAHSVPLNSKGIAVRVLEVGEGPTILLVPGGNGEAVTYVPFMSEFTGYRILAINRPGAGLSDGIDCHNVDLRQLSIEMFTAVMDAFDLESVPIVANSMGGLWTFWFAQAQPDRVTAIVQMGCPALMLETSAPAPMRLLSVRPLNRLMFRVGAPTNKTKLSQVLSMLGLTDEAISALPDEFFEAMIQMFSLPAYQLSWLSLLESVITVRGSRERYRLKAEELASISTPVRFIWGTNDTFGSLDTARKAVSIMPDASLETISGSHVPFLDNPVDCARAVQMALQSVSHRESLSVA